jgi:hypothetical protein
MHYLDYIEELMKAGFPTAIHTLKIIIHRFIVKYILIAPLNTSQADMPYFFETSHEHFVSSIERRSSEIFDYSIKGDRRISRRVVRRRITYESVKSQIS